LQLCQRRRRALSGSERGGIDSTLSMWRSKNDLPRLPLLSSPAISMDFVNAQRPRRNSALFL
jgi:hypothetical protein